MIGRIIAVLAVVLAGTVNAAPVAGTPQTFDRWQWCQPSCPTLAAPQASTQQGIRFDPDASLDTSHVEDRR